MQRMLRVAHVGQAVVGTRRIRFGNTPDAESLISRYVQPAPRREGIGQELLGSIKSPSPAGNNDPARVTPPAPDAPCQS